METLITRLHQDFERGKLTRRQLIQSLTLAAAATSAPGIASVAADLQEDPRLLHLMGHRRFGF